MSDVIAGWAEHRDPAGFSIRLPEDWRSVEGVLGIDFAAIAPRDPEDRLGFTPNVTVVVLEREEETPTGEAFLEAQIDALMQTLTDPVLIDVEPDAQLGRAPAGRSLVSHVAGQHSVTLEQWSVLTATRTITLSATCVSLDYPAWAAVFEEIAAGFGIDVD